jgi:NAD(P)-dependent dehydrogenase (short-subunit alcohol dehydrogenase family)
MRMPATALITGAGRGIGLELARELGSKGWRVLPLIRDGTQRASLSRIAADQDVIVADVAKDEIVDQLRIFLQARVSGLDLLINNAGNIGRTPRIDDVPPSEVADLLQVHCLGALRCVKGCLPALRRSSSARIANITSRLGSMTRVASGDLSKLQTSYSYRIAKAAQNMLTLCLGQELANENIQVIALHPGQVQTRAGSSDAAMTAAESAAKIVALFEQLPAKGVEFYDLNQGTSPW